ncbi:ParB family protein (plasmid) [Calothrix parasitica NIES-267]|uniref:ParB family protein n=1 Tax=Calothrix parasitica NIES-267 TaxID=1973488 RepID=A0A1Z4M2E8_9CYAN|nr:ParB family protein [Calothrix parasitica NIES-267]
MNKTTNRTTKKKQPYTSKLQGVSALLGEEASTDNETKRVGATSVAISQIQLPTSQPRRYFDPHSLEPTFRTPTVTSS